LKEREGGGGVAF
jgi:hypothetical protein